jgi:hypothetical protein
MCIHAWEGGWENILRSKEQWSGVGWDGMGQGVSWLPWGNCSAELGRDVYRFSLTS